MKRFSNLATKFNWHLKSTQNLNVVGLIHCQTRKNSTLSVHERIEDKRRKALLGGGQHRLDAQHKKVHAIVNVNRLLKSVLLRKICWMLV